MLELCEYVLLVVEAKTPSTYTLVCPLHCAIIILCQAFNVMVAFVTISQEYGNNTILFDAFIISQFQ